MDKEEKYQLLEAQIASLIEGETDAVSVMANVCAAIHETMDFFWTGFYVVKPTAAGGESACDGERHEELWLGPFQGPVACMHIPYGRGVCGTAWKQCKTIVVDDVEQFPGHIACSSFSRSEIVVPLMASDGTVRAVLDIDSTALATFDAIDRRHLESIISTLRYLFDE